MMQSVTSDFVTHPVSISRPMILIRRILLGAAAALLIFYFAIYVLYTVSLMRFPFDYDEGEGYEVNNAVYFSHFQSPYGNNDIFPFYGTDYPPLFHIALVPFVWLFGPQYWYGRLIVSAATVLTASAIGFAVFRETRNRSIAALSGLAFLASNYIYHIGPLFRQHMVMVMFETLAVVAIASFDRIDDPRKRRRRLILTMALLLAAGFTKPLSWITAVTVLGWLFLRGPRRAIVWGALSAVVAAIGFGALVVLTRGQFWTNVITGNMYDYIVPQFVGLLRQFISLHGALLILAILFLLYEIYFDRLSVFSVWFVFGAVNGISAGKWGAGDSYFAEMIAALCIMAGIFTARCLSQTPQWTKLPQRFSKWASQAQPLVGTLCCGMFILYGIAVFHMPLDLPVFSSIAKTLNITSNTKYPNFYDSAGWTMGYATIGQMPTDADIANGYKIVDALKTDAPGDTLILSEEAAFSFQANKPVLTNPPHLFGLYLSGHWNPDELLTMIDQQKFGAIVLRSSNQDISSLYPQPMNDLIKKAYKLQEQIPMNGFFYAVMVPNPDWSTK